MGLLLPHNCTLEVFPDLIRISKEGGGVGEGGGKRSAITGFSQEARKRLFELLHTLEYKRVHFVTLTYPAEFPTDGKVSKEHLRVWRERFQRKYGKLQVIWRLEFQKRGAPHFHLLILDCPEIDKEWLSLSWYEVVGSGDVKHLWAGTNVKLVAETKDTRLIMSYVGKYVGKVDQEIDGEEYENVGRYWGKWNVKTKPGSVVEISQAEAFDLVTMLASLCVDGNPYIPRDAGSCTIFGSSPGGDDFARRVVTTLAEIRAARAKRNPIP